MVNVRTPIAARANNPSSYATLPDPPKRRGLQPTVPGKLGDADLVDDEALWAEIHNVEQNALQRKQPACHPHAVPRNDAM